METTEEEGQNEHVDQYEDGHISPGKNEDVRDQSSGMGDGTKKKDLGNFSSDPCDMAVSLQGQVFP